MALGLLLLTGCGHTINLVAVQDARAVMRVKTALVNDAAVGILPIQVRVAGGVATLSGSVRSEADIARAVEVAGAVTGIASVRQTLRIGLPEESRGTLPAPVADLEAWEAADGGPRRAPAIGVNVTHGVTRDFRLGNTTTVGPSIRLGGGNGLGTALGFSWRKVDLTSRSNGVPLGCLKVKPVMAGVGYTRGNERVWASLSVVGGLAFNSLCDTTQGPGPIYALSVGNSVAGRAGVSTWLEVNRRFAVNAFAGYLVTRPRVTTVSPGGGLDAYRVHADAAIVSVGVVYKPF